MDWNGVERTGLQWIGLDWGRVGLAWVGLAGVHWIGLVDWLGLEWPELDWRGLDRIRVGMDRIGPRLGWTEHRTRQDILSPKGKQPETYNTMLPSSAEQSIVFKQTDCQ